MEQDLASTPIMSDDPPVGADDPDKILHAVSETEEAAKEAYVIEQSILSVASVSAKSAAERSASLAAMSAASSRALLEASVTSKIVESSAASFDTVDALETSSTDVIDDLITSPSEVLVSEMSSSSIIMPSSSHHNIWNIVHSSIPATDDIISSSPSISSSMSDQLQPSSTSMLDMPESSSSKVLSLPKEVNLNDIVEQVTELDVAATNKTSVLSESTSQVMYSSTPSDVIMESASIKDIYGGDVFISEKPSSIEASQTNTNVLSSYNLSSSVMLFTTPSLLISTELVSSVTESSDLLFFNPSKTASSETTSESLETTGSPPEKRDPWGIPVDIPPKNDTSGVVSLDDETEEDRETEKNETKGLDTPWSVHKQNNDVTDSESGDTAADTGDSGGGSQVVVGVIVAIVSVVVVVGVVLYRRLVSPAGRHKDMLTFRQAGRH